MPNWVYSLLISAVLALILGYYVARKSEQSEPIKGGNASKVLHYLGATTTVMPLFMTTISVFVFRLPFAEIAGLCIGSFALTAVFLIAFASLEVAKKVG